MRSYLFKLITPEGKIFDGEVESISAPGTQGTFGVLFHHAPLISTLKKGVLSIKQNNNEIFFALRSGILETTPKEGTVILADKATSASSKEDALEKIKEL